MPTPSVAATPPLAARRRRLVDSVPRGVWGVIDQGVVSLANFATPVLVGRFAGQQQLGYYTLGLSVYLVGFALARSLLWTPYTKHAATTPADELPRYTGSVTAHLAAYATVTSVLIAVAGAVAALLGHPSVAMLLLVVAMATVAMLLREHVRRLTMAKLDFTSVLAFDIVVAVAQVAIMVWVALSGRMSAANAFLALTTTGALAIGWMLLHRDRFRLDGSRVRSDWLMNWSLSKWLAAAASFVTLGNQGYRWALPVLAGITELGRLGAAQVMIQITNPVIIGISNFLAPLTAKVLTERGERALYETTRRISLAMLAGIGAFLAVVAAVGVPLIELLLGEASAGVTTVLVVLLTAGAMSEALLIPVQAANVNRGRASLIFKSAVARLLINLTVGLTLVSVYGAEAIGLGMLLGSGVALTWQWVAFAKELPDE